MELRSRYFSQCQALPTPDMSTKPTHTPGAASVPIATLADRITKLVDRGVPLCIASERAQEMSAMSANPWGVVHRYAVKVLCSRAGRNNP